jgi:ABC-2 type transport system permease protein
MIQDVQTVIRHEWRGFFRYGESRRSGWLRWGALLFLATMIARTLGPEFGASWTTVLAVTFIAVIFIPAVVADSFAGERERHTLETLLASRISDAALLLGKYIANALYGWVAALGVMVLGVTAAYLRFAGLGAFQARLSVLAAAALISLLGAGIITGVGVLVSLRAPTVRRATESLAIILIILSVLPALIAESPMPRWVDALVEAAPTLPSGEPGIQVFLGVTTLLLALNALLLTIALARFRRARLIA